jgi:tetratricopeptide (TPR) repeat protein
MLRITAQLINVADGFHLWSAKYDRKLEDVFTIQDEISAAIVDTLKVRLLGEEGVRLAKHSTDDFEAFDLCLQGRHFLNTLTADGIEKGLGYFQRAIQKDTRCALAHSGMAAVYGAQAVLGMVPSREVMPKARSHLLIALELDESLAEAYAWLGEIELQYNWNRSAAERNLKRAIALKPNSPEAHQFYADYLISTGRLDEALMELKHAQDLDPLSRIPDTIMAYLLFVSGRFDDAIEHCHKMLRTEPSFLLQLHLWRSLHHSNLLHEAFVECKKLFTLFIDRKVADLMECVYAQSGYPAAMGAAARELVELSTRRFVSPYFKATLFCYAEDDDEALRWLETAYEERDQRVYITGIDPQWQRVRLLPQFTALLERVGLGEQKE